MPRTLAISLLLLAACSGGAPPRPAAAPTPPQVEIVAAPTDPSPNVLHDRRTEPGVRATAKPLTPGKGAARCGKVALDKATGESDLLEGRLRLRAPGRAPAPLADAPPIAEESRVVAQGKTLSFAVVARETFQLDPDLYETPDAKAATLDVEAPKFLKATFPSEEPLSVVPVMLGKIRAYVARPAHPNAAPGKDTALVMALLLAQEDGALESVGFYARGESVRNATGSELDGCTRLAEQIATTIVPGPRPLERAAGRREIATVSNDEVLALTVPNDWVAVRSDTTARLTKLRPLSLYQGSIHITVGAGTGQVRSAEEMGADAVAAGTLLGHPVEWRGKTSAKGGFFFATEPLEPVSNGKTAAVLVKATRQQRALDEMRGVAETLAVIKR